MTERGMESPGTARPEVLIRVSRMPAGGWESEVKVNGDYAGSGTGATASSALSVAMDILYGDTNDHLNGDHGALSVFGDEG